MFTAIFVLAEKLNKYVKEDLNTEISKDEMNQILEVALNGSKTEAKHKTLLITFLKKYDEMYCAELNALQTKLNIFKSATADNKPSEIVMPNIIKINSNTPRFKGTPEEDVEEWIFQIEASLGGYEGVEALRAITPFLAGRA